MSDPNQLVNSLVHEAWPSFAKLANEKLGVQEIDLLTASKDHIRAVCTAVGFTDEVVQGLVEAGWIEKKNALLKQIGQATGQMNQPSRNTGAMGGAGGARMNVPARTPVQGMGGNNNTNNTFRPGNNTGNANPNTSSNNNSANRNMGNMGLGNMGLGMGGNTMGLGNMGNMSNMSSMVGMNNLDLLIGAQLGGMNMGMGMGMGLGNMGAAMGGKGGKGGKGYMSGGKGAGMKRGAAMMMDDSDWYCEQCSQANWATRAHCRMCNTPRSSEPPTTMRTAYSYKGTNVEHIRKGSCWNCGSMEHLKVQCPYIDAKSAPTVCPCKYQNGACATEEAGCRFLGLPVSTCSLHLRGECTKGTECKYTHLAPPACPHVFQKGSCIFGKQCVLAQRPVDECCFSTCTRGVSCPRRHSFHKAEEVDGQTIYTHPTKSSVLKESPFPSNTFTPSDTTADRPSKFQRTSYASSPHEINVEVKKEAE